MLDAAQEQTARAKALIAERKHDEAIKLCRRVLLTRPDLVEIRLLLGKALLATGRYEQVRVEMMALARKHPNLAELHRILGEAHLRSGQMDKARAALRRAIELDPHDEVARELLGEANDEEIAPVSQTIERWFGDEEAKTVEQELPPHFEETTPVPGRLPVGTDAPSVEVDPSLQAEAEAMRRGLTWAADAGGSAGSTLRTPPVVQPPRPPTALGEQPAALRPRGPTVTGVPTPPHAHGKHEGKTVAARPRAGEPEGAPSPFAQRASTLDENETTLEREPAPRLVQPETVELPRNGPPSAPRNPPVAEGEEPLDDEPTLLGRRPPSLSPPRPPTAPPARISDPPALATRLAPGAEAPRPMPSGLPPAPHPLAVPAPPTPRVPGPVRPVPRAPPPSAPPARGSPPSAPPPPSPAYLSAPGPAFPRAPSPALAPLPAVSAPQPASSAPETAAPRPFLGGGRSPGDEPPTDTRIVAPDAARRAGTGRPRSWRSARLAALAAAALALIAGPDRPRSWRSARLAALAAAALAVVVGAVFGLRAWWRARADEAIRDAAAVAGADGRRASIERALAALEEHGTDAPWRAALRARLLATLTLEHAEDRSGEVEAALASLGPDGAALPDARVARALLLVASGRGADAIGVLSGVAARGDEGAEVHRARAWAAATAGRLAEAEQQARQALMLRPMTPRHAALEASLFDSLGDGSGALPLLESVPDGERSPAIRVARARLLLESGADPALAAREAEIVVTELARSATPIELGWAHLVRARLALGRRDLATARQAAQQAALRAPRWDEAFGLGVAETLLASGEVDAARRILAGLPATSIDPARRAALAAEAALGADDLAAAEQALIAAGSDGRAELLRGRLHEARRQLEQALPLYERAAADPRVAREARIRAGSVLLRLGRPREARAHLEAALRLGPTEPEAVLLFVRAALATGDPSSADAALAAARAAHPEAPDLLAAHGSVLLALGRTDEGLASLQQACQMRPDDADLRAELGEAALRAGRRPAAAAALAEALRLRPGLARAHVALARLAMEEARFDDAAQAIERAASSGAAALDVERLRAELLVARGAGAAGVASVQSALSRHPRDATLLALLGWLHAQAEQDRPAREAFTRALRADDEQPEALLGRAGVETRRGDLGGAARSIDRAERAGRQRGLSPAFLARVTVARARLRYEVNGISDARRLAEQALVLDPRCGEAHLVLAILAEEAGQDPTPHLRSAVAGSYTPAEALGLLAPRLRGAEGCELARRYVAVAPDGYDRDAVDRVLRRCD